MTKNSRFLPNLAQLVAAGSSVRAAAAEVGCAERTAYTLTKLPEFQEMVSTIRTEMIQRAAAILADNATRAAQTLADLLTSDDERIKLAASKTLLSAIEPVAELAELRERIERLERQPLKVAR